MQYCLIYSDKNGHCKIIRPEGNFWDLSTDVEKSIHKLHALAIPDCVEFLAVKSEFLPTDLTFRDAWRKGTAANPIIIDFDHALKIHRQRIQEASGRKIQALDKELEIALENDNTPQAVAIRRTKKILRTFSDLNLTHCKTVDDIKYSIPNEIHDVWQFYPPKR